MPRGYRCVVVAVVGWLALTGAHPKPVASPEQPYADSRVGDALSNMAATYGEQTKRSERTPESPPCGPRQYQSKDDLCAQWKAADAAADAAWWAAFAGWFGGLSFAGVLAAIGLAFHSNWIARDTARRQLRAYVMVDAVNGPAAAPGAKYDVVVKNTGATPATRVSVHTVSFVGPIDYVFPPIPKGEEFIDPEDGGYGVIGANCEAHAGTACPNLSAEHLANLNNGPFVYFVFGLIKYDDIFGVRHITAFRLIQAHWRFGHHGFVHIRDGNTMI